MESPADACGGEPWVAALEVALQAVAGRVVEMAGAALRRAESFINGLDRGNTRMVCCVATSSIRYRKGGLSLFFQRANGSAKAIRLIARLASPRRLLCARVLNAHVVVNPCLTSADTKKIPAGAGTSMPRLQCRQSVPFAVNKYFQTGSRVTPYDAISSAAVLLC